MKFLFVNPEAPVNKDIPNIDDEYIPDKYPCGFCNYKKYCYDENDNKV